MTQEMPREIVLLLLHLLENGSDHPAIDNSVQQENSQKPSEDIAIEAEQQSISG